MEKIIKSNSESNSVVGDGDGAGDSDSDSIIMLPQQPLPSPISVDRMSDSDKSDTSDKSLTPASSRKRTPSSGAERRSVPSKRKRSDDDDHDDNCHIPLDKNRFPEAGTTRATVQATGQANAVMGLSSDAQTSYGIFIARIIGDMIDAKFESFEKKREKCNEETKIDDAVSTIKDLIKLFEFFHGTPQCNTLKKALNTIQHSTKGLMDHTAPDTTLLKVEIAHLSAQITMLQKERELKQKKLDTINQWCNHTERAARLVNTEQVPIKFDDSVIISLFRTKFSSILSKLVAQKEQAPESAEETAVQQAATAEPPSKLTSTQDSSSSSSSSSQG